MPEILSTPQQVDAFLQTHGAAALYFSSPDCNVCAALKPKVFELFAHDFSAMAVAEVDCTIAPEVAAQLGVLAAPTIVVYFDRAEWLRKVRNVSLPQLADELQRPYSVYFSE